MGWDAFGLPAQNAAIQRGMHPSTWTYQNISEMKKQMEVLGFRFNWEAQLATCDPTYFKHTQQIFLELRKRNLVYQKEALVNWDPVDKTVLANQQISPEGLSWRSGAKVQRVRRKQWFFKITEYSDALIDGLKKLPLWPDSIKEAQEGWILRKERYQIQVPLISKDIKLRCFIQNLDQLKSIKAIKISSHSSIAAQLASQQGKYEELDKLKQETKAGKQKDLQDLSIILSQKAVNPLTGEEIELRLTNGVDPDYLQGIQLQFESEISPQFKQEEATKIEKIEAKRVTTYKLRDWLVSRQRYWGVPIPYAYCRSCGEQLSIEQTEALLPILPQEVSGQEFAKKKGHLYPQGFIPLKGEMKCRRADGSCELVRESDTLDTFVDSSWYFLRFLDTENQSQVINSVIVQKWMPVDLYIGGAQHAIMHLLYSRFIHKFLVQDSQSEPFTELVTQGLVQALIYEVEGIGKLSEKEYEQRKEEFKGRAVSSSFQKQSKSKNTGINPLEIIEASSVDIMRLALSFVAPPESTLRFQNELLSTMRTWLFKVNNTLFDLNQRNFEASENISCQDTLQKISLLIKDYHHHLHKSRHVHVAVAKLMELRTLLQKNKHKINEIDAANCAEVLLAGIYPFAPHFASHLWSQVEKRSTQSIEQFRWDQAELNYLKKWRLFGDGMLDLNIQINGKFVGKIALQQQEFLGNIEEMIKARVIDKELRGAERVEGAKKIVILKEKGIVNFVI